MKRVLGAFLGAAAGLGLTYLTDYVRSDADLTDLGQTTEALQSHPRLAAMVLDLKKYVGSVDPDAFSDFVDKVDAFLYRYAIVVNDKSDDQTPFAQIATVYNEALTASSDAKRLLNNLVEQGFVKKIKPEDLNKATKLAPEILVEINNAEANMGARYMQRERAHVMKSS